VSGTIRTGSVVSESSVSSLPSSEAFLLLAIRVGLIALAISSVLASLPMYFFPKQMDDAIFGTMALAVLALLTALTWRLAPWLSRRATASVLPDEKISELAWFALPLVVLGLWFAGSALADLVAMPFEVISIKAIAASYHGPQMDAWMQYRPELVRSGLRLVIGIGLATCGRRIASWVGRR
jgi:hypothetical protein